MTVETFFANFGHLADAPNGVQKLRELILQLAVQGKLVPQDPSDEPASELLEKIEAEKKRLIKEGIIKKLNVLPVISAGEESFSLPSPWRWTRVGIITNYGETEKAELADVNDETWVLELEDVEKTSSRLLQRVRCKDRRFQSSKNRFQAGDVVYGNCDRT